MMMEEVVVNYIWETYTSACAAYNYLLNKIVDRAVIQKVGLYTQKKSASSKSEIHEQVSGARAHKKATARAEPWQFIGVLE